VGKKEPENTGIALDFQYRFCIPRKYVKLRPALMNPSQNWSVTLKIMSRN
jgi:hypothetical protein